MRGLTGPESQHPYPGSQKPSSPETHLSQTWALRSDLPDKNLETGETQAARDGQLAQSTCHLVIFRQASVHSAAIDTFLVPQRCSLTLEEIPPETGQPR